MSENAVAQTIVAAPKKLVQEKAMSAGLRTVAIFEATKGALALAVALALLTLIHRDAQEVAHKIVHYSHLNPDRRFLRRFVQASARINDSRIYLMASVALLYSLVRFVEAYGLWRARAWAEWFAIISGAIYVPIEIYELAHRPSWFKLIVLVVNIVIVAYLIYVRWYSIQHPHTEARLQNVSESSTLQSS